MKVVATSDRVEGIVIGRSYVVCGYDHSRKSVTVYDKTNQHELLLGVDAILLEDSLPSNDPVEVEMLLTLAESITKAGGDVNRFLDKKVINSMSVMKLIDILAPNGVRFTNIKVITGDSSNSYGTHIEGP